MRIAKNGVWLDATRAEHTTDVGLAAMLIRFFAGQNVIDLGCGPGEYVRILRDAGIDAIGCDGSPETEMLSGCVCFQCDLARPLRIPPRDWVLSLEVGEHIPLEYEQAFIDSIDRSCKRGVVISWAYPGQTGIGHVNERDSEYVRAEFERRGYKFDEFWTNRLRQSVTDCWWIAKQLQVFIKETD